MGVLLLTLGLLGLSGIHPRNPSIPPHGDERVVGVRADPYVPPLCPMSRENLTRNSRQRGGMAADGKLRLRRARGLHSSQ